MTSTSARVAFLIAAAVVAAVLVLAIAQVPQPWRGVLVAWLMLGGTAGTFALRLVRHYRTYLGPRLPKGQGADRGRRPERAPAASSPALRVIVSHSANGRRSI